jgi:uncharacterized membrane protein
MIVAKRDDYLWHGMLLHYVAVFLLIVAFLLMRGFNDILKPENAIALFIIIMAGDLVVHEIIRATKWGVK